MSRLLTTSGLFDDIKALLSDGMPVFGTCAGMILLASDVLDGRPDQLSFGAIDISVQRNGYGRQVDSFETDLDVVGFERPFHAVFIRAPKVVAHRRECRGARRIRWCAGRGSTGSRDGGIVSSGTHRVTPRLHARFLQEV